MGKRGIKIDELLSGNERIKEQIEQQNPGWKSPLQQIADEINKKDNNKDYERLKSLTVDIILAYNNGKPNYNLLDKAIKKMDNYLKRKEYE